MSHWSDLWDEALIATETVSSAELNSRSKVLGTQIEQAMRDIGPGVADDSALVVTAGTGLKVNIAAGGGIADSTVGYVAFEAAASYALTVPASEAAVYIYAGINLRGGGLITDPDSREDASVVYLADATSGGAAISGYILLAHCATNGSAVIGGSVVDDRTYTRAQDALNKIVALTTRVTDLETDVEEVKDDLGLGYWDVAGDPVVGQDTVHNRLVALEGAGAGATPIIYWAGLSKSSGDATTISEEIATLLAGTTPPGSGTTTTVQVPSDLEIENHSLLVLRLIHALPEVEETQHYGYYYVPGISDDTLYDAVNTTATVDKTNHTIG